MTKPEYKKLHLMKWFTRSNNIWMKWPEQKMTKAVQMGTWSSLMEWPTNLLNKFKLTPDKMIQPNQMILPHQSDPTRLNEDKNMYWVVFILQLYGQRPTKQLQPYGWNDTETRTTLSNVRFAVNLRWALKEKKTVDRNGNLTT